MGGLRGLDGRGLRRRDVPERADDQVSFEEHVKLFLCAFQLPASPVASFKSSCRLCTAVFFFRKLDLIEQLLQSLSLCLDIFPGRR